MCHWKYSRASRPDQKYGVRFSNMHSNEEPRQNSRRKEVELPQNVPRNPPLFSVSKRALNWDFRLLYWSVAGSPEFRLSYVCTPQLQAFSISCLSVAFPPMLSNTSLVTRKVGALSTRSPITAWPRGVEPSFNYPLLHPSHVKSQEFPVQL
jgi:hypothetical protein